jgi:MFS family permease
MRPKQFYGWYVVAAANILLMIIFGASYSFGAFFTEIEKNFAADRFTVASAFSMMAFFSYIIGVFSGSFADRYSTRGIVALGIVFLASGFLLSSFASQSLQIFMALFCLLVGLGVGLVYVPTISAVQRWFIKRRSKASGIALAGTGVGIFVGPNVAGLLMQYLTWQDTMRIFAVAIAIAGLSAALVLHSKPQAIGLLPDGDTTLPPETDAVDGILLFDALSTARFWWYFGAIFLGSVGLFVGLVHINPFAQGIGATPLEANLLIGLIGVGNVGGRLFLGGVGDRLGARRLLLWLTISLAALNGLWLAAQGMASLSVFALLFGAANGGCISLYPAVAASWFGTRNLGAILGALYIAVGIAAIGGGSVAGLLYDHFHDYTVTIALSGLCALCSAAFLALATWSSPAGSRQINAGATS